MQSNNSACQLTAWRMRCTLLMFMLLLGTDHEKCTPACGRSEKVSAAEDRQLRRPEISLHSGSSQSNSIAMAISVHNNSIVNADYNGAVFMDG